MTPSLKMYFNQGPTFRSKWKNVFFETMGLEEPVFADIGSIDTNMVPSVLHACTPELYYFIDGPVVKLKNLECFKSMNGDPIEVASTFEDNFFDVVYIGLTSYDYKNTLELLNAWFPKVRPYGWICGQGWNYKVLNDIMDAVKDFDVIQSRQKHGKLDTRWLRYQSNRLPEIDNGEWRIKKLY